MVSPRSPSRSASRSPSRSASRSPSRSPSWNGLGHLMSSGPIAYRTRSTTALRERLRELRTLVPNWSPSRSPSRSSAAPGRLIGSRSPSSPPGAPLRGRTRSRSSPSSSSRSSSSSSRRTRPGRSRSSSSSSRPRSQSPPDFFPHPTWKVVKLNNLPNEDPLMRNFNNEGKAIKVSWKQGGKTHSQYYTPESIVGLVSQENHWKPFPYKTIKRPLRLLYSIPGHYLMFKHPTTRNGVQRKNVEFVKLEKRTNKNKAATKIQAAFRGGRERQKTLNRAKRMTALITSKKRKRN